MTTTSQIRKILQLKEPRCPNCGNVLYHREKAWGWVCKNWKCVNYWKLGFVTPPGKIFDRDGNIKKVCMNCIHSEPFKLVLSKGVVKREYPCGITGNSTLDPSYFGCDNFEPSEGK